MNGDFTKLVVSGEASIEECKKCWVKIVEKSFENSGTYDYIGYADSIEGYNSFLCEHNLTVSQLIVLHFQVDDEIIEDLAERGYIIDTSSKSKYLKSLQRADNRAKHLLSRIKIKANEVSDLEEAFKENKPATFDEVMASLIINLGFTVPDNITLSRYNEYRKLIQQKAKDLKNGGH